MGALAGSSWRGGEGNYNPGFIVYATVSIFSGESANDPLDRNLFLTRRISSVNFALAEVRQSLSTCLREYQRVAIPLAKCFLASPAPFLW